MMFSLSAFRPHLPLVTFPNLLTSSRQEGSILGADLSAKERSSNAFDGSNNAPVSNFSPEQLYDIKAVSPPQTHDDAGKTSHTFSLELSLNAGYALEAVRSSSQPSRIG